MLTTLGIYVGAAVAEIAGCFAFWAWLRLDKSPAWVIPGVISLAAFAFLLTRIDSGFAGRAYAAYGGVYIASSLTWLWFVEDQVPDRWDIVGGVVCLVGAAVILWGPRPAGWVGDRAKARRSRYQNASDSIWGYLWGHFWLLAAQHIDL